MTGPSVHAGEAPGVVSYAGVRPIREHRGNPRLAGELDGPGTGVARDLVAIEERLRARRDRA